MSTENKKYVISYLHNSSGDEVRSIDISTYDFYEAMVIFYTRTTGKDSLSAADYNIFYDAIYEMSEATVINFLNIIMPSHEIIAVRFIVDQEVYPG